MIYLQLAQLEENFDKLSISEFYYSGRSIIIKYIFYKDGFNSDKYRIAIGERSDIDRILNAKSNFLSGYDCICKAIIEYLIEKEIKSGTIEVENG